MHRKNLINLGIVRLNCSNNGDCVVSCALCYCLLLHSHGIIECRAG